MRRGCKDCKYCKCYPGGYWDTDEYECVSNVWDRIDVDDEAIRRAWEDGEEWEENEDPICPGYEDAPTEDDEYWEKYTYEERYREK